MAGRRRLRGGLHRISRDHRTTLMRRLRAIYLEIAKAHDVGTDAALVQAANRAAVRQLHNEVAQEAWALAVEQRQHASRVAGGRCLSRAQVERLRRVAALEDISASQAMAELRELVAKRPKLTLAEELSRHE